ncbi:uncharacterized protein LOC141848838 [Brevipalpus obovatus]|uniref:uncharacterized protein LOC141848838 n=1 Tax=Brevipalpus obovatus TaxID=246614 RepID=UPI003D9F9487
MNRFVPLIVLFTIVNIVVGASEKSIASPISPSSLSHSSSSSPSSTSSSSANRRTTQVNPNNGLSFSVISLGRIKEFFTKGRSLDLARTFSSLRGALGSPMTALMYAGSLAVGAIVMLAFYESPISPLPVPPLPDPPVGRFPPEHPIWPPPSHSAGDGPVVAASSTHSRIMPAASEVRPVVVPHVDPKLNQIRRLEHSQSRPATFSKVGSSHPQVHKVTKVAESVPNLSQYYHHNTKPELNQCNGTLCDQIANLTSSSSVSSDSASSFTRDKQQKLFDILMPRTSAKQNTDDDNRNV